MLEVENLRTRFMMLDHMRLDGPRYWIAKHRSAQKAIPRYSDNDIILDPRLDDDCAGLLGARAQRAE